VILVTAGYGNQGRLLLPKLAAAGARVRALRAQPRPEELIALGATEAVVGDVADAATVRAAMEGTESMYYLCPSGHPDELGAGLAIIDAAIDAGVTHVVFGSVLHPMLDGLPGHSEKSRTEARLVTSGLNFTVLQPAIFLQVLLAQLALDTLEVPQPWDVDRVSAVVDLEDVTDVVVKVLTEGRPHFGATYELCGANITGRDVARAVAAATGEPRTAVRRRPDLTGAPHGPMLTTIFDWHERHDFPGNPAVLTTLLGREPVGLDTFVARGAGG